MGELQQTKSSSRIKCLHCGAIYEAVPDGSRSQRQIEPRCQVCGEDMGQGDGLDAAVFRLSRRPPMITD